MREKQFFINEIYNYLNSQLKKNTKISIKVKNPDINGAISYKSWVNLAEILHCKLLTPKIAENNNIELTFKKLNPNNSFHNNNPLDKSEKYGVNSPFFTINKLNEPSFLIAYKRALKQVELCKRKNILNLGINKGDEFEFIKSLLTKEQLKNISFYGIDHSKSAIEYAKKHLLLDNLNLFCCDINSIEKLNLPKMDLIISIGTLQSPSINYKPFLMQLVQQFANKNCAFILGFPNGRWIDGELVYGAKVKNYSYSELSLLFEDVIFAKKYLQQKKFRVTITGKEYIFVTATKI